VKMEVTSRSVHDEKALFDEDDENEDDDEIVLGRESAPVVAPPALETSKQRLYSIARHQPQFEGLRVSPAGHKIQEIKELMTVPVGVIAALVIHMCLIAFLYC